MRQLIHRSILRPLETRAEIQAEFLEDLGVNAENFSEVELKIEPFKRTDSAESIVLKDGEVIWNDFAERTRLQTVRQQLKDFPKDKVSSKVYLNGYVVYTPIEANDGTYQLVKYYNKSLFQDQLDDFYLWMAVIIFLILLLIYLVYRHIINFVTKPIEAINLAVEHVEDDQYQFEYIRGNLPVIDNLGTNISTLKQELKTKRGDLNASEQRLSLLMGHLNLGVVLISNSGKIELINSEAMQLLNIDIHTTQRSFQAVIKSYILVDMINEALKTHQPLSNHIELYIPMSKFIDVNIIPYGKSPDEIESILVLLYDITQVRRLETVRTEFVANASHELRTPVTAIKGFAETLLDGALKQQELAEKFITIIANESNRLETIISDILELSRVEKKSEPMVVKQFEVVETVNNLIQFFYKQADRKHISISVDAERPVMMKADQHRIEQIFTNLIDNAINYSDVDSEVKINIEQVNNSVHFSVSDKGIGIPKADQERIFERFYRVDKGRSRNSGGTGLGLSIVRNLIMNMNGTIHVESEVGIGTTFHIKLPLE
ncbi:MAG TPA: GHKL domain-containing protein [Facklamia tabacinasalis]|nr:GHKL domain-containing protein [Ruoffia tabacinasalis]